MLQQVKLITFLVSFTWMDTLPPRIMEVESGPIVEETSLVGTHFLHWTMIMGERVVMVMSIRLLYGHDSVRTNNMKVESWMIQTVSFVPPALKKVTRGWCHMSTLFPDSGKGWYRQHKTTFKAIYLLIEWFYTTNLNTNFQQKRSFPAWGVCLPLACLLCMARSWRTVTRKVCLGFG